LFASYPERPVSATPRNRLPERCRGPIKVRQRQVGPA